MNTLSYSHFWKLIWKNFHTDVFFAMFRLSILYCLISFSLNCDPGWFQAGENCYLISLERKTWFLAQEYCWSHGGYLAEFLTKEVEDSLDQFLIHDIAFWIGLTDMTTEGGLANFIKIFLQGF